MRSAASRPKRLLEPRPTRKGVGENAALTGYLDITSGPLVVETKGGDKTDPATIDANGIDRIFDGSLTVNGVTLRDGHARTVAGDAGAGGAIRGDVLDIRNSRLIKNTADYHPSNLFVNGSGGAIFVNSGGELRIAETAGDSGAGWPSTRVGSQRSTARPSSATTPAGAGSGGGIGISAPPEGPTATLMVENSTVANNSANKDGGGIGSEDLIDSGSHATVELDYVTVARNQANPGLDIEEGEHAGTGGGIYTASGDSVSIHKTGHNLIGNPDGCTGFGATDLFGGKLKLGKLADNAGPTKTIALMEGSRAIGRADPDAVRVDQRGVRRDKRPDTGAYERTTKK